MSLTRSTMQALGTKAPEFTLKDTVTGERLSYQDLKKRKGIVVMFICNHCPYVKHVQTQLVKVANDYQEQGIGFVAISSNDATSHPQDGPARMKEEAKNNNYPFAYLYDETQEVAKAYNAACTPDFFVYDENDELHYRGQLDESRPNNNKPLDGADLRAALDNLLAGNDPLDHQKPSIGCNIKWKK